MASKLHKCDNSTPVLSGFTHLFLRKLGENLDRKNQNPGGRIVIKKLKSVYAYEIGCMMHTLGDAECPLKNSILYLETVLRDQMNLLLMKASQVPDGSEEMTHEHLLTLLANNREKMTRLLHYLFLKDSSELLGKRKYEKFVDVVINTQFGIRVNTCLEFLDDIEAGDYDPETIKSASDDIALERVARRFQMSRTMSNEQYLSFSKQQCACFYPKGDGGRFKDWLLDDNVTDLQPTAIALDILAFFARETVAEVVESSLLLSQPKKLSKPDSNFPSKGLTNNSRLMEDEQETLADSDLDVPGSPFRSSGMPNFIADCTDSNSDIRSLINSGALGMSDIFALSTSSLYENDIFPPAEESPCRKRRKTETSDSFTESDDEKSVTGEITSEQESRPGSNVQEPKIPARNPDDPITVEDLKSAVMNLIMSSPGQIHMNKTKKILCL